MYPILILITVALWSLLAAKHFRFAICFVPLLFPLYLLRVHIGGIPSTLLELCLLSLFTLWMIREDGLHKLGETWKSLPKLLRGGLVLLILSGIISVLVVPNHLAGLGLLRAYLLEPLLLFFVLASELKEQKSRGYILISLSSITIFLFAFALFQVLTGTGIPLPWDAERRATSIFPYPNALGLFVVPLVPLLFWTGLHLQKKQKTLGRFLLGGALLGFLTTILSQTEAAWIAIPLSILLTSLWHPLRNKLLGIAVLLVIPMMLFPASRILITEKILLQDRSGEVRRVQWSEATEMLWDHPVFGAGLGGYPTALEPYHAREDLEIFQYPHNIMLNIWSELGLLGLASFFLIAVASAMELRRGLREQSEFDRALLLGAGAGLLAMCIHGLVDVPFFKNDLALLTALFLALFFLRCSRRYLTRSAQFDDLEEENPA